MSETKTKTLTPQQKAEREALALLAKLGGQMVAEEDVEWGEKLVLPRSMSYKQVIEFLRHKLTEAEEEIGWNREFPYRPFDGANATVEAIRKHFGTLSHVPTQTMFGPVPPQLIDVEVGFGEKRQIPWGTFEIPAIPGVELTVGAGRDPELGETFTIHATGKRKHSAVVAGLFKLIEQELREHSIYKGRAIDAGFSFLDLTRVSSDNVVYAEDVYAQLEASVFAALRYPEALDRAGVPLKSAVLLHGTYGVGKTLFAYLTAQVAEENGVTFIQVRPDKDDLQIAMQSARMYAPAVVFFEDLDTIATPEGAQDHVSGLLELFDGVRAKGVPIMAIMTTNHADRIHKGMVRPGRLDAVIEITPPDADGIIKLCQVLVPDEVLDQNITEDEWKAVAEAATGYIPAFVHEGCKRAIRHALVRGKGELVDEEGNPIRISGEDLRLAMVGLRAQYEMMQDAKDLVETDPLSKAVRTAIRPLVEEVTEEIVFSEFDRLHPEVITTEREEKRFGES